jgi:hypothetical protein
LLSIPPWSAIYLDWKLRIFTIVNVLAGYLRDLLLPVALRSDYNPPVIRTFTGALPGFFTTAAAGLSAFLLRRRAPLAVFGILFVFTALLPVLNIIPIYNIKADRYLYLPLIGLALVSAAAAAAFAGGKAERVARAGILFYAFGLGAFTLARNPVFRNDFSFFYAVTAAGAPTVPRAEINMAAMYFSRRQPEKARDHIMKALAAQNNYQVRLCWAEMELFMGSQYKSEELLKIVLKENPGNLKALHLQRVAARLARKPMPSVGRSKRPADTPQNPWNISAD